MAAALFLPPLIPTLDSNAKPINGGQMKFFVSGTTTPAPVYADAALATSLGTVITANSAGRYPPIYYNTSVSYRVQQCDANGTPLPNGDIDPYNPGTSTISGEVGVINPGYPVGDVRRYGVFPDGVTNWELNYGSRIAAIQVNACNPLIWIYWPPGPYATSLNADSTYNGSKMFFAAGSEFYGILHIIGNITNVKWIGTLTSYDRVGVTGTNMVLGDLVLKSDPTKNTGALDNRGVNILASTNIVHGNVTVEKTAIVGAVAPASNTAWAGYAAQASENITGGDITVNNAGGHGIYINVLNYKYGMLRVTGYARGAIDFVGGNFLVGTDSEAQSEQATGIWINRSYGTDEGQEVTQSYATPVNDTYSILWDETGISSTPSSRNSSIVTGYVYATVGNGNRGVSCGETLAPSPVCNVVVNGAITVLPRTANTLAAGLGMCNVNAPLAATSSKRSLTCPDIVGTDPAGLTVFQAKGAAGTDVTTTLAIGKVRAPYMSVAGRVAWIDGTGGVVRGYIDWVEAYYDDGNSTTPLVDIDTAKGFTLRGGALVANSQVSLTGLRIKSVVDCQISLNRLRKMGGTSAPGVILDSPTRSKIGPIRAEAGSVSGVAFRFDGTHDAVSYEGLYATDWDKGFTKTGTPVFTNCSAVNNVATGNTTNTSLVVAEFAAANQLGCSNFAV